VLYLTGDSLAWCLSEQVYIVCLELILDEVLNFVAPAPTPMEIWWQTLRTLSRLSDWQLAALALRCEWTAVILWVVIFCRVCAKCVCQLLSNSRAIDVFFVLFLSISYGHSWNYIFATFIIIWMITVVTRGSRRVQISTEISVLFHRWHKYAAIWWLVLKYWSVLPFKCIMFLKNWDPGSKLRSKKLNIICFLALHHFLDKSIL